MAAAAVAHGAQGRPAYVNFGFSGVSSAIAYRVDDNCYISTQMARSWGWEVSHESGNDYRVLVGDQTLDIQGRRLNGDVMLPLVDIARQLDADARWRPNTDVIDFTSRIRVVRLLNGHLSLSASLPVLPHAFVSLKGDRLIVDLLGASLSLDAMVDVAPGLLVTSPKPGSVRVELPVHGPVALDPHLGEPSKEIDVDTTLLGAPPSATGPVVEETLRIDSETDKAISISMPLPEKLAHAPNFARLDANTLRFWLPGIKVLLSPDGGSSPSIKTLGVEPKTGGTELTFQLVRPMGVTFSTEQGFHLRFVKPPVGNGQLAGKTIVVDAGHGGHDSGTKSLIDGLTEKSIALAIAKHLGEDLVAEGATVIMTRESDVFIPLTERAAIANRNHADLFLCVHVNSNGRDTHSSGSITFYHNADPISSTLADCIERQLPAVTGIPGIGIWSDTRIYDSGFSVLRNIRMPGVLIETGFMNNANDRPKLANAGIQAAMAAAIVRGVKVYLGQPIDNEK